MELEIVTDSPSFPASQIEKVLSARTVSFELHEMAVTKETTADYVVNIRDHAELKTLSDELMHADGGAVRSVTWSEKKWMRQ